MTNISFFIKVGAAKVLPKLDYLQSRDTIQKDIIFITKSNIKHFIERCNLLNFRGVKNGYRQDFQYLMASIHFFLKMATLM